MEKECAMRIKKITEGFQNCCEAFSAVGDPTRQAILVVLLASDFGGIRVGEIAKMAHLTRPSVSHHLKILKEAGIVGMRKEGTKNYYYISLDENKWKEMMYLMNTICEGIEAKRREEFTYGKSRTD